MWLKLTFHWFTSFCPHLEWRNYVVSVEGFYWFMQNSGIFPELCTLCKLTFYLCLRNLLNVYDFDVMIGSEESFRWWSRQRWRGCWGKKGLAFCMWLWRGKWFLKLNIMQHIPLYNWISFFVTWTFHELIHRPCLVLISSRWKILLMLPICLIFILQYFADAAYLFHFYSAICSFLQMLCHNEFPGMF